MKFEFKFAMNRYLKTAGSRVKTLADIIAFNEANASQTLRYGQLCLAEAQEQTSGTLTEAAYQTAMADRQRQIAAIRQVLSPFDACLMCSPNNIAHYTGLPSVALPNGLCPDGMPDGIIMTGVDENRLLETASVFETICPRVLPPPQVTITAS
jgi:amidase